MRDKKNGYRKLMAYFVVNGITQGEVAKLLGINRSTFNSKLHRKKADFTLSEVRTMCEHYKLDANHFFLL